MATTTAQITISSSDLLTDALSLTTTATLFDTGTSTGITQAQGPARKTTASTGVVTLFNAAPHTTYGANKAHKVYIKNCSTTAGDWMFIPWGAHDTDNDIKVTPSVSTSMTFEYMLFISA